MASGFRLFVAFFFLPLHPFLIGIAGPSCAGKTELATRLCQSLPEPTLRISLDSYYFPLDDLNPEERAGRNFDHPGALDWDLIVAHVRQLAAGNPIEMPVYLFDRHTRAQHTEGVEPAPYIIFEGLFTLYDERVRAELDAKIFVTTPDHVCLDRRKQRDVAERGRTVASVCRQYRETVRPMAEQFVMPTRVYADLVVTGEGDPGAKLEAVLAYLGPLRQHTPRETPECPGNRAPVDESG